MYFSDFLFVASLGLATVGLALFTGALLGFLAGTGVGLALSGGAIWYALSQLSGGDEQDEKPPTPSVW